MTGGMRTRFRFTIRDDEPEGILKLLGIQVHWTTPYHGQSKPIERMWRDLCEEIARHPACSGAYTGGDPTAKPDNYGSRAIPIENFEVLVAQEMLRHATKPGRRAAACAGRSIAETFLASLAAKPAAHADPAQLRLFLCAAEGVTSRKPTARCIWRATAIGTTR